jgi:hypothetical protein
MKKTTNRRMFLRGAGLFALSIPFLSSLAKTARAAPGPIKRFIGIFIPYGTVRSHWFPADDVRQLTPLSARAKAMTASDIAGDLSPVFQRATYEAVLSKMIFLDGIDGVYNIGHNKTYPFTGYSRNLGEGEVLSCMSIDQIIAERADIYDAEPAFRSLNLAAGPDAQTHSGTSVSYAMSGGAVVPVPQIANPGVAWDYMFKNVASGEEAIAAFEKLKADKLSVLDRVHEDYTRVMKHGNLSRADQLRLEAYADYLRELELSVSQSEAVTCTVPPRPDDDPTQKQSVRLPAQIDNVVHAVRCGLTNVITLSMEPTSMSYPFLGNMVSHHHSMSHTKESNPDSVASLELLDRWHAEQIASLVERLDVVEDPDTGRTFLDNSIVMVASDMGSFQNHAGTRMPCLLFGGKGHFKQDLLVDYRSDKQVTIEDSGKTERIGVSYNNVLITVCQAMGLLPEEYEQGQEGIGDYPLSKFLWQAFGSEEAYAEYAYGDRRTPLGEILEGG